MATPPRSVVAPSGDTECPDDPAIAAVDDDRIQW